MKPLDKRPSDVPRFLMRRKIGGYARSQEWTRSGRRRLGGSRCQCIGCRLYFNSLSSFDRHRAGDCQDGGRNRRCLSPRELIGRGWSVNKQGFWIERATPSERLDALARSGDFASGGSDARGTP
jgi:hypothetical protein